jgi:hypothetical protein
MMDVGAHAKVNDEGSNKRHRGRPDNIDHFHDEEGPKHFIWVIFHPNMGSCTISKEFVPWFRKIPSNITLVTNTG